MIFQQKCPVSLKLMFYKFSTKPQQLFNFWSLFFALATKYVFPPLTVRPSIRKTVHCLWQSGVGKAARTGSTSADLLFHSHHSSKHGLGSALMEGWDADTGLNAEDLIFSHWLADATKPFSCDTIGPSNARGMRAALALPQERVYVNQHHSSIFVQTNTHSKPNSF